MLHEEIACRHVDRSLFKLRTLPPTNSPGLCATVDNKRKPSEERSLGAAKPFSQDFKHVARLLPLLARQVPDPIRDHVHCSEPISTPQQILCDLDDPTEVTLDVFNLFTDSTGHVQSISNRCSKRHSSTNDEA